MKKENSLTDEFNQKRVNHIFHYTTSYDKLIKILKNGFAPSYCKEEISDTSYLIPMVSFCNISIRDVDLYMRYGKYGIGISLDCAIRNRISPVIYFHENSPFNNLHSQINEATILNIAGRQLRSAREQFQDALNRGIEYKFEYDESDDGNLLGAINNLTVPTLQYFKYWKTFYKGKEIITYQEREWRFIPQLKEEKRIIPFSDSEYKQYSDKKIRPKPHLANYSLELTSIVDLRYLIIKEESQRNKIIEILTQKFGKSEVTNSIIEGKLLILTEDQIRNDF